MKWLPISDIKKKHKSGIKLFVYRDDRLPALPGIYERANIVWYDSENRTWRDARYWRVDINDYTDFLPVPTRTVKEK